MKYPINYDFGNKWDTDVVPHLSNPKIKKAIAKGVKSYLSIYPACTRKYKQNTAPASYSSKDAYVSILDKKWKYMLRALRYNKMVPKIIINLEKEIAEYDSDDDDDVDIDDLGYDHMVLEDNFRRKFFTWNDIKDDLETYYISGACFWWAPTFELELAKLVDPDETWYVRESGKHATVINEDDTKIFDLLYWVGDTDRLDNYMFGKEIEHRDPTLGGKDAYLDSDPDLEDEDSEDEYEYDTY